LELAEPEADDTPLVLQLPAPAFVDPGPYHADLRVEPSDGGVRLDSFLCTRLAGFSRGRATDHLAQGRVQVIDPSGRPFGAGKVKPSLKLFAGLLVTIDVVPRLQLSAEPEAIALDIIYEDEDLLVVNKPAGMVVHPALGHEGGTLVNALLHHAPAMAGLGDTFRPGLVHRIDKDTSGLLVVTKTEAAMRTLALAFARHDLERRYAALVLGTLPAHTMTIRTLHGRHATDRKRFTGKVTEGKEAVTHVQVLARGTLSTLCVCTLETGRSHQIRMHLSEKGHPLVGDALYGGVRSLPRTPKTVREASILGGVHRQALHAYALGFRHPRTGEQMRFEIGWPSDLAGVMTAIFGENGKLPGLGEKVFRGAA